jgi:CheY-like chemotaxis protein
MLLTGSGEPGAAIVQELGDVAGCLAKPVAAGPLYAWLEDVARRRRAASGTATREPVTASPAVAGVTSDRPRVLLVEDNPINRKVALHMLQRMGYDTEVATNGEEALAALARASFAAVLMDCQMPVMDGYAATRELRRREGSGRRTPVIALTASAMTTDRDRCIEAGMDDYLSKPVWDEHLASALKRLIAPGAGRGAGAQAYRETIAPGIEELVEHLRQDHAGTVIALAQELHPASAKVGAYHLSELLHEIEDLALRHPEQLHDVARTVEGEHRRVLAELHPGASPIGG